ncbi:hypothetical protein C0Q70_07324 [Pomacea canaliculata]|uniref:Uncharacterized protein n=1 Tax=Pomacea canaliculata TaxID=400727 RepID=A0A2T7PEQ4_POMCA|nr:hypothetical protein C0Q70_07324 [Pomacea canaliculata]
MDEEVMEEKDFSRPVFLRKPGKHCDVTMAVPLSSLSLSSAADCHVFQARWGCMWMWMTLCRRTLTPTARST